MAPHKSLDITSQLFYYFDYSTEQILCNFVSNWEQKFFEKKSYGEFIEVFLIYCIVLFCF